MSEQKQDKMKDFLKNLSKKEKIMAYVAGFFLLLVMLDRIILVPIMNKLNSLEDGIERQISVIKDGLMILGYKEKISKEYEMLKPYFVTERKTQEEELADFLKEVENLAVQASVQLVTINPSDKIEETPLYIKYQANLECIGSMEKMMVFLYSLSNLQKLMKIETFELMPVSKGSNDIKCSMLISRVIVTE